MKLLWILVLMVLALPATARADDGAHVEVPVSLGFVGPAEFLPVPEIAAEARLAYAHGPLVGFVSARLGYAPSMSFDGASYDYSTFRGTMPRAAALVGIGSSGRRYVRLGFGVDLAAPRVTQRSQDDDGGTSVSTDTYADLGAAGALTYGWRAGEPDGFVGGELSLGYAAHSSRFVDGIAWLSIALTFNTD